VSDEIVNWDFETPVILQTAQKRRGGCPAEAANEKKEASGGENTA
jgi:hypothetical protein